MQDAPQSAHDEGPAGRLGGVGQGVSGPTQPEHRARAIWCRVAGHDWQQWENVTVTIDGSRWMTGKVVGPLTMCKRCKLTQRFHVDDFRGPAPPLANSPLG